jgi:hypothetical protein
MTDATPLRAIALVCTLSPEAVLARALKATPYPSS